ncbi:neuritin-like protein isoform X2 [Peromyscus californicus insignis]|uniref:neuritin-like protein isoform X2 n=1 Tax=Peromyscus californicus insignis TaxID=564181 RepID=UPI0022A7BAC6|nr:neuritin-like protein isoform X2 [Peromyscus californicus insignis]
MMCCCHHCHWRCRCQRRPCALTLLLLLPLPLAVASEGLNRCDTIYQGFAECLIRLGDGMGRGGELQTVCRSWNDFHACASRVLSGCPEEAAAVWESLQQEARRAPHPDNLHVLCGAPVSVREMVAGPETNQETLRATAPALAPAPAPSLFAAALALACLLGPLA